jgi:hypothetical protein
MTPPLVGAASLTMVAALLGNVTRMSKTVFTICSGNRNPAHASAVVLDRVGKNPADQHIIFHDQLRNGLVAPQKARCILEAEAA